jgi:transposase
MTNSDLLAERKLAIFQLMKGKSIDEVAQSLDRSSIWVSEWHKRFKAEGWQGLKDGSRATAEH